MVKVGVIGVGYWGPNLVRNFLKPENSTVAMVADASGERLKSLKEKYPDITVTTDYQELLDADIDAVAIATPVSTHYRIAAEALDKGKHVLLEKPMAANTEQVMELIELARKRQRCLMVDHPWVYDGAIRRMKDIVSGGQLGKVYSFGSVRANLGLFQRDVNVVWDLAPHDFSIMNYLFEAPPEWVSATGICPLSYGGKSPECIAYITVGLGDGAVANIHLSWLSPEKIRKITICGTCKMLVYNQQDINQIKVYEKGVEVGSNSADTAFRYKDGAVETPEISQTETLEVMCQHFVDCIEHRQTPITDGTAGLRVVRLLECTEQALRQDGGQVKVDFGGY